MNQQQPQNPKLPKTPTSQLVFPNAENTTSNQIANLIQIGSFALHALLRPGVPAFVSGGEGETKQSIPKEAEIAAELTFIKVCETFETILQERERWSLDTQKKLAARFEEAHDLNLAYLRHQAESARLLTTPHFRFRPALMRLRDGRILAIIGSVDDLDNAIVGLGQSAEEALKHFDETFEQGLPTHILEYLAKREAALENGQPAPPFPGQPTPPAGPAIPEEPKPETKRPRRPRKTK